MNTEQKFFHNIVHNNAITYQIIDEAIGDLGKNSALSASTYENSTQIVGNTISENEDLLNVLISSQGGFPVYYNEEFQSDKSDDLQQSLQNFSLGIAYTVAHPSFDIPTHISTSLFNYNASISSSFLSAQIYQITGISSSNKIIIPESSLYFDGYNYRSHLADLPLDFAVFGLDGFNGLNYNQTQILPFDYAWSSINNINNLIINLNFSSAATNYYLGFYWGCQDSAFICTSLVQSNFVYIGTNSFLSNIGINTLGLISPSVSKFYSRKNFWSNNTPYSLKFNQNAFVDTGDYLFTPDRLNQQLFDGVPLSFTAPEKYNIYQTSKFSDTINNEEEFVYLYYDSTTSGVNNSQNTVASINGYELFTSKVFNQVDTKFYENLRYLNAPLYYVTFQKNPRKLNLSNFLSYDIVDNKQLIPSAFVRNIRDEQLWNSFSKSLSTYKNYYDSLNALTSNFLNTLDNFFASFLFGATSSDVASYFLAQEFIISKNALKNFTQPYGYNKTDPLNFSNYEEKSIFTATNIVSSKEYVIFNEGVLSLYDDYFLPADTSFEIFKPVSVVCNGIDPFNQGVGLALDYTLNLSFEYTNQNTLNKTLYLMASKYLISQLEYENRTYLNQDTTGYYYYVDPINTQDNTNSYSVSSIREFYLYGYAGLIPDLKDGAVKPILTRQFSPEDGTKFTYDQYVAYLRSQNPNITQDQINEAVQNYLDNGGEFYTINTNSFSSNFVRLKEISLNATNMINTLYESKYWNDKYKNPNEPQLAVSINDENKYGFTNLYATINSGFIGVANTLISNISVGYNCNVASISVVGLGASQQPGTYKSWILPPSQYITDEQPAYLQYTIASNGYLDGGSFKILNPGANFHFDFDYSLSDVPLTGIGGTNAVISVIMDNTAKFQAISSSVNSGIGFAVTSFKMIKAPKYGYNAGFKFDPYALNLLGFGNSFIDINILLDNFSTVDSFLIAETGLTAGKLENISSFQTQESNFSKINYTIGTSQFSLFDKSLINSVSIPSDYFGKTIDSITLYAKLIQLNNSTPSGTIQINIYDSTEDNQKNNLIASSDLIQSTSINSNQFDNLQIPINFKIPQNAVETLNHNQLTEILFWIEVVQNLNNSFVSLQGTYKGINTSSISLGTSLIANDPNSVTIPGTLGNSSGKDLDIGRYAIQYNILENYTNPTISSCAFFIRKDPTFNLNLTDYVYLSIGTSGGYTYSNQIPYSAISTSFTKFDFVWSAINTNLINTVNLVSSVPLINNQVYISRDLTPYSVGFGTTSILNIGTSVNYDYVFNVLFSGLNETLYGAFNYVDKSQFGLANPNKLREQSPILITDGYWSFTNKFANKSLNVYPRAYLSASSIINDPTLHYKYMGYTHNIYLNLGYNSNNVYRQELITLTAQPSWKTTWMFRNSDNFKNFTIQNIALQSYFDSIDYVPGTASTLINITEPTIMNAIFSGTFTPDFTSISTPSNVPLTVAIGTNSGIQVFINNSSKPIIDTFSVVSAGNTSITYNLDSSTFLNPINFNINYFTLSTASISVYWNLGIGQTLVNKYSAISEINSPYSINNGLPIDNIVFMNISKTQDDATSVNSGFPPGDSFVIRSS